MSDKPNQPAGPLTCEQAQEAVSAAMDGELAAADRQALDRHLQGCEACAAYAEQLSYLQSALPGQLSDDTDTAAIWDRVQTVIDAGERAAEAHQAGIRNPRRRFLKAGLAASLAMVAGGAGLYGLMVTPPQDVIAETVNDYLTFRASGKKLHILDSRHETVAGWLAQRVDFDVALRNGAPLDFQLLGGRLCSFLGRRLVFLHFTKSDYETSLYVMRDDGLTLPAPANRSAGGRALLTRNLRGVTSAAWQQSGLIYVVVANMDEDALIAFAAQV